MKELLKKIVWILNLGKFIYKKELDILRKSEYFEEEYYYILRPDVLSSKKDAALHYLLYGWKENANPSEYFNTSEYLNAYSDVNFNPLLHYECFGKNEGRGIGVLQIEKIRKITETLTSFMRIDIKNFGNVENGVLIMDDENINVTTPAWFADNSGKGRVVSSKLLKSNFKIKAINDGKITFRFKGADKRYQNIRFQAWVDYKSIKIDGKQLLFFPVSTWHDKTFIYEMSVYDKQEITIEVEQSFHKYFKEELKSILLKLFNDDQHIIENIDKIINCSLLTKFINPIKSEVLSDYPQIEAQVFISLGNACRSAFWLKKYNLRKHSLPFDWMMGYSLQTVFKTIKIGFDNWFEEYWEDKNKMGGGASRYVIDTVNNIISMHGFPRDKSIEEFMPEFKTTFTRRCDRLKSLFFANKKICFLCYRNDSVDVFIFFLDELKKMYPKCEFSLINIIHSKEEKIIRYSKIESRCDIYEVYGNDINENGANPKTNPSFWIGNSKLWNSVCSKMSLVDY